MKHINILITALSGKFSTKMITVMYVLLSINLIMSLKLYATPNEDSLEASRGMNQLSLSLDTSMIDSPKESGKFISLLKADTKVEIIALDLKGVYSRNYIKVAVDNIQGWIPFDITKDAPVFIETYRQDYSNLMLRSRTLYAQGQFDEALELTETFILKYPYNWEGYLDRADRYDSKSDYPNAFKDYEHALNLINEDIIPTSRICNNYGYSIGKSIWERKLTPTKVTEAIKYLERSIKITPNWFKPYNNLGVCYLIKSDFCKAKEYFRQSIAIYKQDPYAIESQDWFFDPTTYGELDNIDYIEQNYLKAEQRCRD